MTFSVKNDVNQLISQIETVENKIRIEKEAITIYETELSVLTNAGHIKKLLTEAFPEMTVVSSEQIITPTTINPQTPPISLASDKKNEHIFVTPQNPIAASYKNNSHVTW